MRFKLSLLAVTLLVAALSALTPSTAHADIVYSNFSPATGFGYNLFGYTVGDAREQIIAVSFTPTSSYNFTSAELATFHGSGTNSYNIFLRSSLLGANLATGNVLFPPPPPTQSPTSIVTWTPSTTITLDAGTTYWLLASGGTLSSSGAWMSNSIGQTGLQVANSLLPFSDPGTATPAFRINGTLASVAAPEPTTLSLALLGISGLIMRRKRRDLR
jgi:hypothetical protein